MTQFRATTSTTQSITANIETQLTFGAENFDTDAGFLSSRFTVPASWNGLFGEFFGSVYLNADENGWIAVQVSTNGGSIWSFVTRTQYLAAVASNVATGPVLMNTGDIYRVTINNTSAATVQNDNLTFFSGRLINPATVPTREYFRAQPSSAQVISNSQFVQVNLGTEVFDTGANFASSVYTVPADLNGGYGIFNVGLRQIGATEDVYSYIMKSTDGGSTYPTFMAAKINQLTEASTCTTGPVALVTGDKYRAQVFTNTGGFTLDSGNKTFLAGELYI